MIPFIPLIPLIPNRVLIPPKKPIIGAVIYLCF